jgi:hypothetical protein
MAKSAFTSLVILTLASLPMQPLRSLPPNPGISLRLAKLPRHTVWTWERREDLRSIDPATTAIAPLAFTLVQDGPVLRTQLQRNSLTLPSDPAPRRIAVVRLETHQPELSPETARRVAQTMLKAVQNPAPDALQIDFDAVQSERAWYRLILTTLRAELPPDMPLSITALASWCSHDRWMSGLPIDEAVPMLFRMEPGVHGVSDPEIAMREPLCMNSAGISTRARWPEDLHGKRVYLFPDRGWQRDNLSETLRNLP